MKQIVKQIWTSSDIGSVAIDCGGGNIVTFSNGYGDGTTKVYVFENEQEFKEYEKEHIQYFFRYGNKSDCLTLYTTARFSGAEILNDDCAGIYDGDISPFERSGIKMTGRYAVYYWTRKVYFVKIQD